MIDSIYTMMYYMGWALVWCCLGIVALKILWNMLLPYGMMRLRPGQAVSIFPLIEFVPLTLAIIVSFLTQQNGILSPAQIALWGLTGIVASYLHFAIAAFIYGIIKWLHEQQKKGGAEKGGRVS